MNATIVYPNQLFYNHPGLSKNRKVFIIQDPIFFGDRKSSLKFHKQKILLHLLSIEEYNTSLKNRGYKSEIILAETLERQNYFESFLHKYNINFIHLCYVIDFELNKRINSTLSKSNVYVKWYENPGFLLSSNQIKDDFSSSKKYLMANFYKKQRKRFNILIDKNGGPIGGKWSYDKDNRKKLPKNIEIPLVKKNKYPSNLYRKSVEFVNKNYSDNPGELYMFNYPINREQALESFEEFLHNRFYYFGDYEDAISEEKSILFHSLLTPYLNIGLVTPKEILKKTLEFSINHSIPLNSLEGFIRQIIGWREFIRGIYESSGVKQKNNNYWNFKKKIPIQFYTGQTDIYPVDVTIDKIKKFAYCHHIERLMILGNIMFLLRYNPDEVYKWFMELFIDSYDWVMVPNIYGMSQYSDGGIMSTKPYISGSNYILKMSNYKKGTWMDKWDSLYWTFIDNKRSFFLKNPRMSMMVSMYDKKNNQKKYFYKETIKNLKI